MKPIRRSNTIGDTAHPSAERRPLWVISGHMRCNKRCPLYPNSDRESGFPAKDHVCFTPESGHVQCKNKMSALCQERHADFYSITSSARASIDGGIARPSAFAVLRLITSSYLVGACTGRSAGFSPLRMRST